MKKIKIGNEELVYPKKEYLLTPKGRYKVILRSPAEILSEGILRYTIEVENATVAENKEALRRMENKEGEHAL